jgi:hypothetical protein
MQSDEHRHRSVPSGAHPSAAGSHWKSTLSGAAANTRCATDAGKADPHYDWDSSRGKDHRNNEGSTEFGRPRRACRGHAGWNPRAARHEGCQLDLKARKRKAVVGSEDDLQACRVRGERLRQRRTAETCFVFARAQQCSVVAGAIVDFQKVGTFLGMKGCEDDRDRPRSVDQPSALHVVRVDSRPITQHGWAWAEGNANGALTRTCASKETTEAGKEEMGKALAAKLVRSALRSY